MSGCRHIFFTYCCRANREPMAHLIFIITSYSNYAWRTYNNIFNVSNINWIWTPTFRLLSNIFSYDFSLPQNRCTPRSSCDILQAIVNTSSNCANKLEHTRPGRPVRPMNLDCKFIPSSKFIGYLLSHDQWGMLSVSASHRTMINHAAKSVCIVYQLTV